MGRVQVRGLIASAHLRRGRRAAGAAPPPTRPRSRKCLVRVRDKVRDRVRVRVWVRVWVRVRVS